MTLTVDDVSEPLRLSFTETKNQTLFLVDLSAVFWHAWHATNKESAPDEAAEATISRIHRWAEDYPCIGICCDDPNGNWRYELYPEYKATRKAKPPGAKEQLARTIEVLTREGFPVWMATNHEGDDVIASAATTAAEKRKVDVIICGADKDLAALICDRVSMLNERTGLLMREADVRAKFGVRPSQIGDWLAIVGDTSDNIPGVPGIGEKGAANLLTRFWSLTQVVAAAKDPGVDLSASVRSHKQAKRSLIDSEERLKLTRQLVSLRYNLPIPIDEALSRTRVVKVEPTEPANDAEMEDAPHVCPGCSAVAEPCAPGCPDELRRREEQDAYDTGPQDGGDGDNYPERCLASASDVAEEPPPLKSIAPTEEQKARFDNALKRLVEEQRPMTTTTNGTAAQAPARKVRNAVVKGAPKQPHAFILTGRSGIGKTFLASTIPKCFFESIEQGLEGASKAHVDDIARFANRPTRYGDLIADMQDFRENYAKQDGFRHFVTDGLTGIERLVNKQACDSENVSSMGGKEFSQVWLAAVPLWQRVQDELDLIRAAGVHVWVIAHSSEVTETIGETGETWTKYDLQLQGNGKALAALRNMWRAWSDHCLFVDWDAKVTIAKSKKSVASYKARILRTRETPQHYAKNRANLPPILPATWVDLERAMRAGAAGGGPAPDLKLRQDIETLLPQVPDDGDREGLIAETKAAKNGAILSAILSRVQGLIAAARDEDAPEETQSEEVST
jgi:5'-3' exonuclease